ncbi:cyclic beta 1-2 glucan synthetase [Pantoea sp. B65]
MERFGETLALSHHLTTSKAPYFLLKRLEENELLLAENCQILSRDEKNSIGPAGEWLLDNFYLIEEQIRVVRQLLPKNFGKGLPALAAPHHCPRIYHIATEAIAHGDGRWDDDSLTRYVAAYQKITPLTLGELWALPGMLRLALFENLRRVSSEVAEAQQERNLANDWVTKMLDSAENDPASLIIVIADMARSNPPRTSAFVAELVRRLQGHGSMLALPLTWMEQRLGEVGLTTETLIHRFNQQQAASQLSVSNSITGLRLLSEMNWADFAENLSLVEQVLRQDPADIYARMHFATRDRYRHVVELLARYGQESETAVARRVLALAQQAPPGSRKQHIGYYLIDAGRTQLEAAMNIRFKWQTRIRHRFNQMPLLSWFGSLSLLITAFSADLLFHSRGAGLGWPLWLLLVPIVIVVSQFVTNLLSEATTRSRLPQSLPRLDFSAGIPAEFRTLVVIPCLLASREGIDKLINSLEVCFIGNDMAHLHFALLTDFHDSLQQTLPEDAGLLSYVCAQIEGLNRRYAEQRHMPFLMLHREREWNQQQGVWMGYERKRGKLYALNRWLRQQENGFTTICGGDAVALATVKYVITLDSDTVLPRASAHQLIATLAHPLNHPIYDAQRQRVVEGYTILQPRLAEEIPRFGQSRYAALNSTPPGSDPYSLMSSDIYQDLFGEGSFVGKGIYDVEMFSRVTEGTCPENLVLSHDLLEGCYVRSGLLSDVVLYEQYPVSYMIDVARRSRWIRGDWQLLNWLRPQVRKADGSRTRNPLSTLSRWKLLDNLRRSLVAPCLLVLLFAMVLLVPNPFYWLSFLAVVLLLPTLVALLQDLLTKPAKRPLLQHIPLILRGTLSRLNRILLSLATLPHEAGYTLYAIAVTLWRLGVSQRNLNEWMSFDQSKGRLLPSLKNIYRAMWLNPLLAVILLALSVLWHSALGGLALDVAVIWLLAPAWMLWLSRAPQRKKAPINAQQRQFLRQNSREIWLFFETFVNAQENGLPPDNYQQLPKPVIAHRTSPTNIGLSLLANLTAWDFGYITCGNMLQRITLTLDTLDKMEHYRGHLYNWYDTRTLQPLKPRYISSVDSGNMAGHLLTLSAGLVQCKKQPVLDIPRALAGLEDTLQLLEKNWPGDRPAALPLIRTQCIEALSCSVAGCLRAFAAMQPLAEELLLLSETADSAQRDWAASLLRQVSELSQEAQHFLGWITDDNVSQPIPSLLALARQPDATASAARLYAMASARQRLAILDELELRLHQHATMDFAFLYNPVTDLLSVGYNCEINKLDSGHYDLLPSEIRLTSYFAIATNQLPLKSWQALGRLFTVLEKQPALMSWSGSMFEYLMPQLVMPGYPDTLLVTMCQSAVNRQIAWGKERGVPWGISESGWYAFDASQNYRYHAFGVPGLGLRRGLGDDMVIAPYATMMALVVDPQKAIENLQTLEGCGARGKFGFYEALDYTTSRLASGQLYVVIRSWMAHHQGMSFLALSHLLLDAPMVERFASHPRFQSARFLLQERVPDALELYTPRRHFESHDGRLKPAIYQPREFTHADSATPEVQLLSNGNYHLMLTQAGGSYSRWKEIALTRWREDATRDNYGSFCYLSDPHSDEVWSTTLQPLATPASHYRVVFTDAGAEYHRSEGSLSVKTQIVISPEDDVELRRLTLTNHGRQSRIIEITTYAEVVLAAAASDASHPAFSNLFLQTECIADYEGLLCHRRPREESEVSPWLFHMMAIHGNIDRETSFETDRAKFIGRGRTTATPQALQRAGRLSNSAGAVLDPIIAIRQRVQLEPDVPLIIDVVYGVTESRTSSLALMEKYRDHHIADRVFELAWSHSQVVLRQLNANEDDASEYNRLAGALFFANPDLRASAEVLMRNRRGQSALWAQAISGDLPIVAIAVTSSESLPLVTMLINAHSYWRLKGVMVDLLILNNDMGGYMQELQNQILSLISAGAEASQIDKPGGIFVRSGEHMSTEDHTLLMSAARIFIDDRRGGLLEQLNPNPQSSRAVNPLLVPLHPLQQNQHYPLTYPQHSLHFANGSGGFSADGREYVVVLEEGQTTPAPWSNVIANDCFGTVISESGQAYSWFENAHEYRLTPWENDPVSDRSGEAFYLRDEESGVIWSPMPLPRRGSGSYLTRHGFGYSVFEHHHSGIESHFTVLVAEKAAVKLFILTLKNHSGRTRRVSATGYVEWVLAELRGKSAMHIVTTPAPMHNGCGVLASHHFASGGSERTAFFAVNGVHCSLTGDRREFIGRNGSLAEPAALKRNRLSDKTGAGLDPCGALQSATSFIDGDSRTFIFALGVGETSQQAQQMIRHYLDEQRAASELDAVHRHWHRLLDNLLIETPDQAVNLLANGWLLYQTLSSRMLARSGYYQSGGAFGFRDQLQDSLALAHAAPERMRQQILLCASRQFIEGDVQHWWHPPAGNGVRTRCSDDFLWLPLAICHYVEVTGDHDILQQPVSWLEGRLLEPGEESRYEQPLVSREQHSLWQHGLQAIEHGLRFGSHGLPLMGSGDWNDGMNLVGIEGRGESVWLGFFLFTVLRRYAALAEQLQLPDIRSRLEDQANRLQQNLQRHGWDGDWYRRGYFDNGEPLGSHQSQECRIDAIAQSWAVLSHAGEPERCQQAMQALDAQLVDEHAGLIKLLMPPFDGNGPNPGYIRGYLPGVRENGGQYTHGAIWAVMAFAEMGNIERAWQLMSLINPINHALDSEAVARYKVEPYVISADVYAGDAHSGRGGWSWYTGSAGWAYRLITESLLGIRRQGRYLLIDTRLPQAWPQVSLRYQYGGSHYHIVVKEGEGDYQLSLDGQRVAEHRLPLEDDGGNHQVEVILASRKPQATAPTGDA